jgi:type II secretory pathway pseudopilin PulG
MVTTQRKDEEAGKRMLTRSRKMARYQRGLGLVETLVAVAILGTSVVAFVVGLSAGSIAVGEHDEAALTQSLAQSQLEYTKSYAFSPGASTYPTIAPPAGYSIAVSVGAVPGTDINMQKITVTILRGSASTMTVEDYKVNR